CGEVLVAHEKLGHEPAQDDQGSGVDAERKEPPRQQGVLGRAGAEAIPLGGIGIRRAGPPVGKRANLLHHVQAVRTQLRWTLHRPALSEALRPTVTAPKTCCKRPRVRSWVGCITRSARRCAAVTRGIWCAPSFSSARRSALRQRATRSRRRKAEASTASASA